MTSTSQLDSSNFLIGNSSAMQCVRGLVRQLAPSAVPVLIQGPTGAGKELVARGLHLNSGRPGNLVAFNVCAVADGMFEDALFGHARGAFTGAIGETAGYLLEAHRGTVFLDEISGLPLATQAKLLRAIDTKEFRQLGSRVDRHSDFRVVSATNDSLADLVAVGSFRQDLYFRLRGAVIDVPALAERTEDVPLLAQHFAATARGSSKQALRFTDDALQVLLAQQWPGNVRELRAVVECAVALADRDVVREPDVTRALSLAGSDRRSPVSRRRDARARSLLDVLVRTRWSIDMTAAILGIHRATVYRRLKRLDIVPPPTNGDSHPGANGSHSATRSTELTPSPE